MPPTYLSLTTAGGVHFDTIMMLLLPTLFSPPLVKAIRGVILTGVPCGMYEGKKKITLLSLLRRTKVMLFLCHLCAQSGPRRMKSTPRALFGRKEGVA